MVRLLKYDKRFLIIYTQIICILIIYMFFHFVSGRGYGISLVYVSPILIMYGVNLTFHKLNFMNDRNYFFVAKYISLITVCYLIYNRNLFISGTAMLFYLLICMELVLTIIHDRKSDELLLYFLLVLPVILGAFLMLRRELLLWSNLFFVIQFIIVQIGLCIIITINNKELKDKIREQTELWEKSEKTNKELFNTKLELEHINKQMSKQKIEMEKANKKLNIISSEMYTQNELLCYISSVLDISELMKFVTDAIIGAIGVDTCLMAIYDGKSNSYQYYVKSNHPGDYTEKFKKSLKSGLLDKYFERTEPHTDNNVDYNNYSFIDDRPVGSITIIPLIKNDNTYGLLIAEHELNNMFSISNIEFLKGITTQINIAINNANLYAKMEDMAIRDGLTGLFNRKYTQTYLLDLIENNTCDVITIALLDIDKFKDINDTFGHLFGDKAIKIVANIARKYANNNGIVGRFGGEEFLIILPSKTVDESVSIIEQMHSEIKSTPLLYERESINLNVSIGISSYPHMASTMEELFQRADNAMYYSKENGRGRIIIDKHDNYSNNF